VGEPEGKRPPGRPRRRWVDNIMKNNKEKSNRQTHARKQQKQRKNTNGNMQSVTA
jgi:hypothetical protein